MDECSKYIHLIYIALVCFILEVWLSGLKRHPAKVLVPVRGPEGSNPSASAYFGGVPEWSNGAVSKTVDLGNRVRGFESHPLRLEY